MRAPHEAVMCAIRVVRLSVGAPPIPSHAIPTAQPCRAVAQTGGGWCKGNEVYYEPACLVISLLPFCRYMLMDSAEPEVEELLGFK